jgi:ABC-type Mn2+/Zn2+ transport system ATPase subunit
MHHSGTLSLPTTLVRTEDLDAGYGAAPVLTGVSFALHAGERMGVLGPNGGGKTTLFRVLLGELAPMAGTLQAPARFAVVPQTERSRLDFPVSALDVALMGSISTLPWWRRPGRAQRRAARAALAAVGLGEHANATFGDLSGGQRQRVLVARALVQDARVILLDEPFTGLDAPSADRLEALLAELAAEGRGVMIATHDVDQARAWDSVLCLNRRQVAFGPPAATLDRDVLEATYGGAIMELPGGEVRGVLPPHHH